MLAHVEIQKSPLKPSIALGGGGAVHDELAFAVAVEEVGDRCGGE